MGKNQDLGSGINIPHPQHCVQMLCYWNRNYMMAHGKKVHKSSEGYLKVTTASFPFRSQWASPKKKNRWKFLVMASHGLHDTQNTSVWDINKYPFLPLLLQLKTKMCERLICQASQLPACQLTSKWELIACGSFFNLPSDQGSYLLVLLDYLFLCWLTRD